MLKSSDYNVFIKDIRTALKEKNLLLLKERSLQAHALIHNKSLTNSSINTFQDEALLGLSEKSFRVTTSKKYNGSRTLAFFIFHLTRIEDMCSNALIANGEQVIFQNDWIKRLNIDRVDTGNSMSKREIQIFSESINQEALFQYRLAVAKRTRKIIKDLTLDDLKRKPSETQLNSLIETKSVLMHKDSIWLIDFWGRKNIGELILMPITRHQKIHLSDCASIIKNTK